MRPNTLSQATQRIIAGEPRDKAYAEFLDFFYGLPDPDARYRSVADEPPLTGDARLDALAGAAAAYLTKKYASSVPSWTMHEERFLREPWFTADRAGPGISEFLWHSSPAEFRCRNIFTESRPLRRASQPWTPSDQASGHRL